MIVPPEYERYIIVQWGDRVYPNPDDYFGFNNDHTGYVPILGASEGFLVVNHEYTSYPFHQLCPATNTGFGAAIPTAANRTFEAAAGLTLPSVANIYDLTPEEKRKLYGEQCYNIGLSVLRVKRRECRGPLEVVSGDSHNRRVHLLSGLAVNIDSHRRLPERHSWGPTPHEKGDANYLVGTGPAAKQVFESQLRRARQQDHRHRLQLLRRRHALGHGLPGRGELSGQRRAIQSHRLRTPARSISRFRSTSASRRR